MSKKLTNIACTCIALLITLSFHQSAHAAELETWDGNIHAGDIQYKRGSYIVDQKGTLKNVLIDSTFEVRINDSAKDTSAFQRINLTDGSKINGDIGVSNNFEELPVKLANGNSMTINGKLIQSIEFKTLDAGAKKILSPPGPHCVSRNGKTILCDIEWISNNDISIKTKAGRIKLQREKIHLLGFSRPVTAPINKSNVRLHTRFNDSLIGRLVLIDENTVQLDHSIGRLSFKRENVYSIETLSEQTQVLSSLEPVKTEQTPYMDYIKKPQINANLFGGPLVLDGIRFDNGISMHSRCAITYNLNSAYKRFITCIGLDHTVTNLGDADFVIITNGNEVKRVHQSGADNNQLLHIDTTNIDTLTIMVDYGKNGSSGDHAIWGNPRLIK